MTIVKREMDALEEAARREVLARQRTIDSVNTEMEAWWETTRALAKAAPSGASRATIREALERAEQVLGYSRGWLADRRIAGIRYAEIPFEDLITLPPRLSLEYLRAGLDPADAIRVLRDVEARGLSLRDFSGELGIKPKSWLRENERTSFDINKAIANMSIQEREAHMRQVENTIDIPADIRELSAETNTVTRLLTARDWEKAAIVWAFTKNEGRGRREGDWKTPGQRAINDGNPTFTPPLTCEDFAERLGIAGLTNRETVALYRKRWADAIADGYAAEVHPGDRGVILPDPKEHPFRQKPSKPHEPQVGGQPGNTSPSPGNGGWDYPEPDLDDDNGTDIHDFGSIRDLGDQVERSHLYVTVAEYLNLGINVLTRVPGWMADANAEDQEIMRETLATKRQKMNNAFDMAQGVPLKDEPRT